MNVHDLPMVIFTVFSQLAVGTFLTLGVMQVLLQRRYDAQVQERVLAPVMYAVGPVLVVGLIVSMLHMNDVTNTFNVIRHAATSWLSREILFGVAFAAGGFAFALLEWFKWGSYPLRRIVAAVTALLGIGLVTSEAMVYYSVRTVPAWHSWAVIVQFFATTILLGVLAVGAALMVTTMVRARKAERTGASAPDGPEGGGGSAEPTTAQPTSGGGLAVMVRARVREINAPSSVQEWEITSRALRWIAVVGSIVAIATMVAYPIFLGQLSQGGEAAQASFAILTAGSALAWRLGLLGLTTILLGFFVYRMAGTVTLANARRLASIVVVCLLLAMTSELIGRALHYAANVRVGL